MSANVSWSEGIHCATVKIDDETFQGIISGCREKIVSELQSDTVCDPPEYSSPSSSTNPGLDNIFRRPTQPKYMSPSLVNRSEKLTADMVEHITQFSKFQCCNKLGQLLQTDEFRNHFRITLAELLYTDHSAGSPPISTLDLPPTTSNTAAPNLGINTALKSRVHKVGIKDTVYRNGPECIVQTELDDFDLMFTLGERAHKVFTNEEILKMALAYSGDD